MSERYWPRPAGNVSAMRIRALGGLLAAILGLGLLTTAVVATLAPLVGLAAGAVDAEPPAIDLDQLDGFNVRSYVYASDGTQLATLYGPENRQPVPLDAVPHEVVRAILAVEDAEFYLHGGVNLRSTLRALVSNVDQGDVVQGGSTITQQLVKNSLLEPEDNLRRRIQDKVREATLALELERRFSKDEILEKYLNTVYFGSGAYGVQAAAETYWGKDVGELGWSEAALLAGLISNPSRNDPRLNPDRAARQRTLALGRLVELGDITQEQADALDAEPLPQVRCTGDDPDGLDSQGRRCEPVVAPPSTGNYFVEDVRQALINDPAFGLGDTPEERAATLYGGGLRITTTLDPRLQTAAEEAVDRIVPTNDLGVTAAMVSVENSTGAVRTMVGGPGFENYRYNITTQLPGRQTGSSFKTFVLLTALEQGAVPADSVAGGGAFPNPGGSPDPYPISGAGGTLTSITAGSSNGGYVRLGQLVGLRNVGDVARRLGLRTDFGDYPISLPLGTLLTTPMDMASSFSAIGNEGVRHPWYLIERVEDAGGNVLFEHRPAPERALTRQQSCLATQVLTEVVRSGTATRARLDRQVAAGKTGTTEKNADAWFTGFTPYLTTSVWMGNPDAMVSMANLGGVANFGGTYPAALWREFNTVYHADKDVRPFPTCGPTRPGRFVDSPGEFAQLAIGVPPTTTVPEDEEAVDPDATPESVPPNRPVVTRPPTTLAPPTTTTPSPPAGGGGGGTG
jgi:membrane peptidoglycan carboxypeptidase